jgi:hypothetical protein
MKKMNSPKLNLQFLGEEFRTLGIPSVGDIVVSTRGLELEVYRRKWYSDRLEIELWLVKGRFASLNEFEKWYRNCSSTRQPYES